jgi:hypothetical protein
MSTLSQIRFAPIRLANICLAMFSLAVVAGIGLCLPVTLAAQNVPPADAKPGSIIGTVTDVNGDPVPNSTVVLKKSDNTDGADNRSALTPDNGFFQFHGVNAGASYQIVVSAKDFSDWTSPAFTLEPGQFKIVGGIQMRVRTEVTQINVTYGAPQVATAEEFKEVEQQRAFGFIPNYYVAYDQNAAPLTAKMKFKLALKVSTDPVTFAGVALISASRQAANTPHYGQGWGPYGERFGSTAADGFSDIMIGGAILPALLHQDPRYFYQGEGSNGSRLRHAVLSAFIARGDNGKWQPNYSTIGGDLASSALSNLYYPQSNRGAGLVFGNFAIGTAERIGANVAQEFILGRVTRRGGKMK